MCRRRRRGINKKGRRSSSKKSKNEPECVHSTPNQPGCRGAARRCEKDAARGRNTPARLDGIEACRIKTESILDVLQGAVDDQPQACKEMFFPMSLPFLRLQARPGAARGKERVAAAGTGERRLTPEPFLLFAFFILAAAALFLTGCSRPVNAPRTLDEYAGNTLF